MVQFFQGYQPKDLKKTGDRVEKIASNLFLFAFIYHR